MTGRSRGTLRTATRRLRSSGVPILQCALAAGLAWLVATELVGHPTPFFAPIAAVVSLGISLGSRLRRAGELVVGVSIGIGVGDLLIAAIGSGAWQIALVVALAMVVAVVLDGGPVITVQAGASGVLIATLLPGGGFPRAVDALVGGVIGLAVAAVLPPNPLTGPRRQLRALLGELAVALDGAGDGLHRRDSVTAADVLIRVRHTQPLVDELRTAVGAGTEITTLSPRWWRKRKLLQTYESITDRVDYALRNVRVLARRALAVLDGGEAVDGDVPEMLGQLAAAVRVLRDEVGDGDLTGARDALLAAATGCGDDLLTDAGFSGRVVVAQVRSVLVDLLQATGLPRTDALAALPPIRA